MKVDSMAEMRAAMSVGKKVALLVDWKVAMSAGE